MPWNLGELEDCNIGRMQQWVQPARNNDKDDYDDALTMMHDG